MKKIFLLFSLIFPLSFLDAIPFPQKLIYGPPPGVRNTGKKPAGEGGVIKNIEENEDFRPLAVSNCQIFSRDDIEKSHCESVTSFLQSKGVQILSYGAYGLDSKPSVRGFTDETVRVVIDGVCVNNAQYGTFDWSSVDLENVESIEIVRGGFSEDLGGEGAVAATIYITTRKIKPEKLSFFVETRAKSFFNGNLPLDSTFNKAGITIPFGKNVISFTANGNFANNRFIFNENGKEKGKLKERKNSEVGDGGASIKFVYGRAFSVSENIYIGSKNVAGSENNLNIGLQKDVSNRVTGDFNWNEVSENLEKLNLRSAASWALNYRTYSENFSDSRHLMNTFLLNTEGKLDEIAGGRIEEYFGVQFVFNALDSTNDGEHFLLDGTFVSTTKFAVAKYFTLSIPLSFKFSGKNAAGIPKIALTFGIEELNATVCAYRMVQFPNMDDLFWTGNALAKGNPDLKSEKGWGGELIFNNRYAVPFSFSFFVNYYNDKIQWAAGPGNLWKPQNIAGAFYLGFNLNVEKRFFDRLVLKGNVEYLYNYLLEGMNKGNRIMWTPDWTGGISVAYDGKNFYAGLDGSYMGKRFTENNNVFYLRPYFLLNATVEYRFPKFVKIYARAENILNETYVSVPDYPVPKASLTVGVRFSN